MRRQRNSKMKCYMIGTKLTNLKKIIIVIKRCAFIIFIKCTFNTGHINPYTNTVTTSFKQYLKTCTNKLWMLL